MRVYWLCPLVSAGRPNSWMPAMELVFNTLGHSFPTVWATTDAIRAHPYALGASDCTTEELAAIQSQGEIHVFQESEWAQEVRQVPLSRRSAYRTFVEVVTGSLPPTDAVVRDTLMQIRQTIDNRSVEDLLDDLVRLPTRER